MVCNTIDECRDINASHGPELHSTLWNNVQYKENHSKEVIKKGEMNMNLFCFSELNFELALKCF